MSWTTNLIIVFAAFLGGLVQSTTGFGAGIMMMLFFPYFLTILQSTALSSLIGLTTNMMMLWTYRKHIRFRLLPVPLIFYMAVSTYVIRLSTKLQMDSLKIVFGLFLIALAVFFLLKGNRLRLKPSVPAAAICSTLSGTASGLFGIGGPPMVVYFLSVIGDDIPAYLGTLQCFFLISSVYNFGVRILNGFYTAQIFLLAVFGLVGMITGQLIGKRIIDKMPVEIMKKVIYAFLGLSGLITVINCLLAK